MTVYVREQGAYVKKISERIVVVKNGKRLNDIPVFQVSCLSLIGNVQISTQAIQMAIESGVEISFFSYGGKYIGKIIPETSRNIFLRFEQYEIYRNLEKRMTMGRKIVENKVQNQIEVIRNHNWNGTDYNYQKDIREIEKQIEKIGEKATANAIMGVEGVCSAIYFRSFGKMFKGKIEFDGRNRRPPKDPINIILSLAYTFLTKEVETALETHSFETYLGFLHGLKYGRKSLALDIVEEFRQPVVDRLVVLLFNKRMMNEFDFEDINGAIRLTESGFQKFCREYEKWMKQPISKEEKISFRHLIRKQASELKMAIIEHREYEPYKWNRKRGNNDVSGEL